MDLPARHGQTPRDLSIRVDIIKTMHRAMSQGAAEPDVSNFARYGGAPAEPILGRFVERGLHDELKGTAYAVIEGIDGRTAQAAHRPRAISDTKDLLKRWPAD